jgi:hypothetical protein
MSLVRKWSSLLRILAILAVLHGVQGLLATAGPVPSIWIPAAQADDDDDDDDGDGGAGDGGAGDGGAGDGGAGAGAGDGGAGDGDGGSANGGSANGGDGAAAVAAFGQAISSLFGVAPDSGGDSFEPDELLTIDATAASLARAEALGFRILSTQVFTPVRMVVTRLAVPDGRDAIEALAFLRDQIPGTVLDLNHIYRTASTDCSGGRCYGSRLIGWPGGLAACTGVARVGIVDTAVEVTHPALSGQTVTTRSFAPEGKGPSAPDHGTAVAALLVGDPGSGTGGLLPEAALFAADAFYTDGDDRAAATAATVVAALDWLATADVQVIGLSLSGSDNLALRIAVGRLAGDRTLLFAAAGNEGPTAGPVYPAAYDGVVAVTAVDSRLKAYRYANRGDYVVLAAPGVRVWSAEAGGDGDFFSGTSFAVPFATALGARLLGSNGRASPERIVEALRVVTLDLGDPGKDDVFGWGLLQVPASCAVR